jgi:methionyl-tRNA synthetase
MPRKYYITTAIDYVNSAPHIGTAYEKVSADVFARFHRMIGDDVYFQMGNDEHSLNVLRAAKAKGMEPKAYCDEMEVVFRGIWDKLEVSFDYFIRTTEETHESGVRKLFEAMADDLYRGHYEGYYCDSCEAFYREKDLEGGCCPTHGVKPSWIAEENYFFRLSKYADRLLEHIEANPGFIEPASRRNEIVQLIRGGLEDISVTRASRDWGVPFPMDESEVIYVWFDALINYVTGVGYGRDEERFAKWWPADVHVIGKDVTRFHCVIWPTMLMSAGVPLPKKIYGHGFVYFKGQRLSKSRGVVVDPLEAADAFGPCALRYFLMREGAYGRDMDFTWERFRSRYDSELANDLGNLVSRAAAMVVKFTSGELSAPPAAGGELAELAASVRAGVVADMEAYAPQSALTRVWELVRRANTHIEEKKPWVLAKEDRGQLVRVLGDTVESIRQIAILAWPVMPGKCEEILSALGFEWRPGAAPLEEVLAWGAGWPEAITVEKGPAVFPKYSDEELTAKFDIHADAGSADGGAGATDTEADRATDTESESEMLSFDEFKKLDLRLARVLEAKRVEGTDKLLSLTVDVGDGDERPMVAGIAEKYDPDALVGKTIVVVANLEPAKIRGVESRAMLLAATGGDEIAVVVPDKDLPPGTKVS